MKLTFAHLTKQYGSFTALEDFSYTFTPGVYGLLGPNGAGKSTLMNILTGNLQATAGRILLDGTPVQELGAAFRKRIGFMPQQQGLYPEFTLEHFLWYMASLKGLSKKQAKEEIPHLIQLVNLNGQEHKRLGGFSGGMKQRALIAQAMLGKPDILILDEPTAGLDPKERIRIRNLIAEAAFDRIVLIATHVVTDVAYIAKEILLLKQGTILDSGTPPILCKKLEGKVFLVNCAEEDLSALAEQGKICNITREENGISVRILCDAPPPNAVTCKPDLEDVYLRNFE